MEPRRKTGFSKRPGSRRKSTKDSEDGLRETERIDGMDGMDVLEGAEGMDGFESSGGLDSDEEWEEEEWVPDVFLFEYGTVVIWGMTEREEKTFLKSL